MSIAILVPTKGRPQQFERMVESANSTSSTRPTIYEAKSGKDVPEWLPTVHKWNLLAEKAFKDGHKLFMLGADDMIFKTNGWDTALLDHYNALENKIHVYHLQDSRDKDGTPHVIVTREWIEAMGYFLPPIFLHWYIDSWTVEIAKCNGVFTYMRDYLLEHDKPSDKGEADATHTGIRAQGWHERDQYVAKVMFPWLLTEQRRLRDIIEYQTDKKSGCWVSANPMWNKA